MMEKVGLFATMDRRFAPVGDDLRELLEGLPDVDYVRRVRYSREQGFASSTFFLVPGDALDQAQRLVRVEAAVEPYMLGRGARTFVLRFE